MAPNVTRILVPTDFSDTADVALTYAKTVAGRLNASLHVIHVLADPYVTPFDVATPMEPEIRKRTLEDVRACLLKRLDAEEEQRFRGTRAIVTGLAAKQIAQYAADHSIDLIVMGTHGRRGVAHLLLGSVAEHVGRIAPCPVLTVRDPQNAASKPAEPTSATARVA
jgi:nucleotide-binding universal stress UspA family protein